MQSGPRGGIHVVTGVIIDPCPRAAKGAKVALDELARRIAHNPCFPARAAVRDDGGNMLQMR